MKLEWDVGKERINKRKHGVAFSEACFIFTDPYALTIFDRDHSGDEERWITIGQTMKGRILTVVHTYRRKKSDEVVRIISARKATQNETMNYIKRRG